MKVDGKRFFAILQSMQNTKRLLFALAIAATFLPTSLICCGAQTTATTSTKPIEVKVVVIAMFEAGKDTGDFPGEYQYWVERERLDTIYPLPAGNHDLRMNDRGVMGILAGVGTAKASASIMALGLDPRFDLSHAYFLVAGIAGGNPNRISLGSAAWAEWIVDGEIGHELDGREIPAGWTTGHVPLRKTTPYELPVVVSDDQVFELNPSLVEWAYERTKDTPLADNDTIRARRALFPQAAAMRPPFVMKGDEISSSTFWHGKLMSDWATAWVDYYTGGKGQYTTTAMEETGSMQAMRFLAKAGKVDLQRVLVLRTVSNYDQQRPGLTASESLAEQKIGKYGAYFPSLEAAYAVGHTVVDELADHWAKYKTTLPAPKN